MTFLRRKLILKLEILIADWRRLETLAPIGRAKENLASIRIFVLLFKLPLKTTMGTGFAALGPPKLGVEIRALICPIPSKISVEPVRLDVSSV